MCVVTFRRLACGHATTQREHCAPALPQRPPPPPSAPPRCPPPPSPPHARAVALNLQARRHAREIKIADRLKQSPKSETKTSSDRGSSSSSSKRQREKTCRRPTFRYNLSPAPPSPMNDAALKCRQPECAAYERHNRRWVCCACGFGTNTLPTCNGAAYHHIDDVSDDKKKKSGDSDEDKEDIVMTDGEKDSTSDDGSSTISTISSDSSSDWVFLPCDHRACPKCKPRVLPPIPVFNPATKAWSKRRPLR